MEQGARMHLCMMSSSAQVCCFGHTQLVQLILKTYTTIGYLYTSSTVYFSIAQRFLYRSCAEAPGLQRGMWGYTGTRIGHRCRATCPQGWQESLVFTDPLNSPYPRASPLDHDAHASCIQVNPLSAIAMPGNGVSRSDIMDRNRSRRSIRLVL